MSEYYQQRAEDLELLFKQVAVNFFRYWYNAPGSNTDQGFDDWWEQNKHKYIGE